MTELTREQFRAAVAAAISSVHHLYREVDRLMVRLKEHLAEEPNPLTAMSGMSGKGGRDPSRLSVRNEYGMLFKASSDDGEEVDEEDEDDKTEDETEDDDPSPVRSRSKSEIVSDELLLAVRIGMYDPQKGDAYEPQIQYAVMCEWTVGGVQPPPGQPLVMERPMLRRIPRALGAIVSVPKGGKITTRATVTRMPGARRSRERRLTCQVPMGVEVIPLYALESAAALEGLAKQIKTMWADALAGRDGN